MKQKKFWRKLLSLGLAAAMTIASLTGPGSVTNPVEVKAENIAETLELDEMEVEYNGQVQKPTVMVKVTTGSGIEVNLPSGGGTTVAEEMISYCQNGSPVSNGPKDAGEYEIKVTLTTGTAISVATGTKELTAKFTIKKLTIADATDYFTVSAEDGSVTLKESDLNDDLTGHFTVTYKKSGDADTVGASEVPTESGTYDVLVSWSELANIKATTEALKVGTYEVKGTSTEPENPTQGKSEKPTISGEGNVTEFVSSLKVTITAADGADIYYTLDGTTPTPESNKYVDAITIDKDTTVKAIAVEEGKEASEPAEQKFTKKSTSGGNTGGSTGGSTSGGTSTTTPTTPSTGSTTTTETKPDGTKVETTTETKADGTKVETVTETKTDGSATTTVKETEKNSLGKEVAVTTVTEKDASGKVQSETTTSVIASADVNTSATVTAVKDSTGAVTATATVTKAATTTASGKTNGTISSAVVKQITEAAGTTNVTIAQTVTKADGSKKFTVEVNAKDLVSGVALKIMKLDPKTGDYVFCNAKDYTVSAAGGVSLSIKTEGDFILVNEADAKAASDAVLKTVKVKNSSKTVAKGKTATVAMSSGLNMKNVSKITYTVSNKSVATVNKNGKVTAKKSGTVTVKAKVTLKNGKTKTVKMTIKVK